MQRLQRALTIVSSHAPLRCTLFLLLAWLAALEAVAQSRGMNMFHDAQFLSAYERHARLSVLGYGQFPFWDPYSCGGLYGLAAPQTRYASPFFLFTLWLDVDRASALLAIVLPALGMEGLYRYARSWNARSSMALVCAPIFSLSGFFAGGWRWGWVQFLSFNGVPFILLGLRAALRGSRPGAYLCAVSSALTMGVGGTWTLPISLMLALWELLDAGIPSRALRSLAAKQSPSAPFWAALRPRLKTTLIGAGVSGLLVASVCAARLWPMLESAKATLRVMGGEPVTSLSSMGQALFVLAPKPEAGEGTYYVTPVVLLALLALPLGRARLQWCAALFIVLLSFGHFSPYAPFSLLRRLPVYDTIRYPERCLVLFALSAAVVLATGASAFLAWIRKRWGRAPAAYWELGLFAVLAVGVAPQIKNTWVLSAHPSIEPAPQLEPNDFRQSRGNRWLMSHFAAEGMGSLGCGEAYPLPMSHHLRGDLPAEEYLVDRASGQSTPQLGTVRRVAWSPNRIELAVDAKQNVRLAINQNYHPGWHSSHGQVESWDGLLSVALPKGSARVVLEFWPRSGVGGLWVSLLSLIAGALYAWGARLFPRLDHWQRAALLGVGPGLFALFLLLWPEARWEHPLPVTPDAQPVLLSALPSDAEVWQTRFDAELTLEGSRLPREPLALGSDEVTLDLFFRRNGKVSASVGIFLYITMPDGRRLQPDHAEISGQLYLPRIPVDAIALDRFRVALPSDAPAGSYHVRVGLWTPYAGGARRHVVDPGRAKLLEEDAVVIGSFTVAERR